VTKDLIQAHKWITLAAVAGNKEAIYNMEVVETRMSQDQIDEAIVLEEKWLLKQK
jgi:TPR repeat protein